MGSNGSTYTVETTSSHGLKKLTINLTTAGDLASAIGNELNNVKGQANCVVITGPVNAADLQKLYEFSAELLDISGVVYSGTLSGNISVKQGGQGVVIPSSWSLSEYFGVDSYKHSVVFQKDGTELNTYVVNSNGNYCSSGLVDIMSHDKYDYDVFDGMTAFSIHEYQPYSNPPLQSTTTVDANIVNAMNSTNYDIKTINLENGKADNLSISIQNGHIETLNLSGLQMTNGTTLNIGGEMKDQMALKNLNLTNVKVGNVDATNLETLEAINLKGANLTNIDITQTDGDYSGIVISVDDPALESKITPAPSSIWGDDVSEHVITDRSITDNDGCSITPNEGGTVATVHAVTPGHFKTLFLQNKDKFGDGVTFKFDSECNLNAEDLSVLAGENITHSVNFNRYYVDLYDVPVATTNIEAVITEAIGQMRTNNWQYKGLLLPKNPTTVGTTLIADRNEDATKQATCSQFIAYNNGATTVAHVYNADNTATATYGTNVGKLESVLELHPEIGTNTTNYLVTTNSTSKVSMSALPATATRVETINNDMVNPDPNSPAKMYVYPSESGKFDNLVDNTGVAGTEHLDLLELNDAANPDDFTAINSFTHGPRVLDLRNLTSPITKAMLESLTNSHIEFILLPEDMANKEEVCEVNYSASMTSLKAVIASTSTTLAAHVAKAGSLAEARILVTGGSTINGVTTPTPLGLTSVTLSGKLNATDISANNRMKIDASGHWTSGTEVLKVYALSSEQTTIKNLDLEDAVFETNSDMNFSYAGLTYLLNVKLPTDPRMTTIPAYCFQGVHLPELSNVPKNPADITTVFHELCIPYNYQYIEDGAFDGTMLNHITTTDANGALIDNGPLTYTLSANIKRLGTKPSNIKAKIATQVFPHETGVLEIYSLATKTPECYKGVFPANAMYGYGGFIENMAFCRDKYFNSGSAYKSFAVLRFPSEDSYNAVTDATKKDESYLQMKKNYTDINKVFTKKEQTGAVDANGDPVTWPSLEEVYRAFNQASLGLTWTDWKYKESEGAYDSNHEICGGQPAATANDEGIFTHTSPGEGDHEGSYTFDKYAGWHQIILSQATYVDPAETVDDEKIIREYEDAGWYTLCIPYSLTEDQVINWLGVPKSTDKIINKLDGEDVGNTYYMPDVRTLRSVTRKPGKTNEVTFLLTNDLVNINSGTYQYWSINDASPNLSDYGGCGATKDGKKIVIRGGYPYIIKVYKRKGETIKNLGKYLMKRYADVFEDEVSCVYIDKCHENLNGDSETAKFAKPFEHHKVQAFLDVEGSERGYTKHHDGKNYYYTFIGQFWDQPLPRYAFYMVNNDTENMRWYRYTSGTKNYTWEQYKCIIMATQEVDDTAQHPNSGKYRDNDHSRYPEVTGYDSKKAEIFKETLKIEFLNGRDDALFSGDNMAKYAFAFDDNIQEFDADGNQTNAIMKLDGVDLQTTSTNGKVFNAAGQYVGNSVDGLGKGLYIVNGKKIVIQ